MKERFRDFAGISNLNHFFQFRPLLHYYCCRYLIRIIYIYVVVYYRREAELKPIISCSEHKALRFLSFVQFTVLLIVSSLKQNG